MKYIDIKEVDKTVKQQNNGGNGRTMCMRTAWYSALLVLGTALLILTGCPETPSNQSDTTAPDPIAITSANITTGPSSIGLQWDPSPSDDVATVQVTWTPTHGEEQPKSIAVGSTSTTITDLRPGTTYTFFITTIDTSDNVSSVVEITATTSSAVAFEEAEYTFTDIEIAIGSIIGIVSATTEDSGVTVAHAIVPSDNSTLFAINADTGEITVAGSGLNAENQYRLTVQATSSQGATATASVLIIPRDTINPAPVTSLGASVDSGTEVSLTWANSISGDVAMVRITWVATGSSDADSTEILNGAETTTITGLTSEVEYTFTVIAVDGANNESTPETITATTADITGPLPVANPRFTANSGTAVTLTWTDSTSDDAATVRISWMADGSSDADGDTEVDHGVETADITGLTSETRYTFTLTVVDQDGNVSSVGTTAIVTTADITDPAEITMPVADATSGATVTVTWIDSASDDATIVHITWTPEGSGGADGVRIMGRGIQEAMITGLNSQTPYTFTLVAEDAAGNRSEPVTADAMTLDITGPDPVTGVMATPDANGSVITLNWDNSPSPDAAAVRITWSPPRDDDGADSTEITDGSETTTIAQLTDDTPYTFTLVAVDGNNNPSAGVPITVSTIDVTDPDPVDGVVAATTAGTTAVTLSWTNSGSDDATIVRITWSETESGTQIDTRDVVHGTTSTVITGLTSELEYTFTLIVLDDAIDTAGAADPNLSAPVSMNATTPDVIRPNSVTAPSAMAEADGSTVTLNWTDSDSDDAAMVHITWTNDGDTGATGVRVADGVQMRTITGLTSETEYTFTFVAEDAAGNRADPVTADATTPDVTRPNSVTAQDAMAEADGSTVMLDWTDSDSDDATMVHITWTNGGPTGATGVRVADGVQMRTITGLASETEYTFTFVAEDAAGNRADPVTADATTPDVTPPEAVTSVMAIPLIQGTNTPVRLSWTNSISTDVVVVRIAWGTSAASVLPEDPNYAPVGTHDALIASGSVYAVTGLTSETQYHFSLIAEDAAGNTEEAATTTATTPDVTDPAAVTSVTATPLKMGTDAVIELDWTASGSDDVTIVRIAWGTSAASVLPEDPNYAPVGTHDALIASGSVYTVTGLTSETAYHFTLVAIDAAGNTSTVATTMTTTLDVIAPDPVTSVMAAPDANGSTVRLNWTDSNSDDADEVHITWTPPHNNGAVGVRVADGIETATITGLTDDTPYTFTLVAVDDQDNLSTGEPITVVTIDVTDPEPVDDVVAATTPGTTDVTLSWTDSSSDDATTVSITWSETGSGTQTGNRDVAHGTTSTVITGLTSEQEYTFTFVVEDDAVDTAGAADPNFSASVSRNARPDDNVPDPVTDFTITQLGDNGVVLDWTHSTSGDADTVHITWASTTDGVTPGSQSLASGTGSGTHTVNNLVYDVPYTFTIIVADTANNMSDPRTPASGDITFPAFSRLANGVTIVCPGVTVGGTFVLDGVTYTRRTDFSDSFSRDTIANNAATTCTTGATSMVSFIPALRPPALRPMFNADISHWDTSRVTNMRAMFSEAAAFDQDISNWDVSQVANMSTMFLGATAFNQDLSAWCVTNIATLPSLFDAPALDPDNTPVWGSCPGM